MRSISSAVRACGNGTAGSVPVTMVFASSGRVTTATAGGQFAGSPIGSCAAQRARSAQLPPFSNSTFTVTYPFTVQ
jgi:hypothetical protein